MNITKSEPVLSAGAIGAAAVALVALLVAFGVPLTDDQQSAILGVVAVVAPFIVAVITRRLVTPNDKVAVRTDAK